MRYVLGVLAVLVVLITAFVLIFTRSPSSNDQPSEEVITLTEYADTGAQVIFQKNGELVASEDHLAIRITADRNQRKIEILSGYDGSIEKAKTYPNTSAAFEEFIYGLSLVGFEQEQEAEFETEKGVCPNGTTAVYTLRENGEDVSRLWSSSCDRDDGTFGGDRKLVEDLFEDQIPDFRVFTRGIRL